MLFYLLKNSTGDKIDLQYIVNDESIDILKTLHNENLLNLGKIFAKACGNNSRKVIEWIYNIDNNIIHTGNECPFRWSAENGYFHILQWLYEKSNGTINVRARNDYAFKNACKNGHLDIAKWIYSHNHIIDLSTDKYNVILWIVQNGHMCVLQWLYDSVMNDNDKNSIDYNKAFRLACKHGHKSIAKYILELYPDTDIHSLDDYPFYHACINGHTNIAKWIYKIDNTILEYVDIYIILKNVIINGHLNMLQWFYSILPNISEYIDEYSIYKKACMNNRLNIVKWITNKTKYVVDKDINERKSICFRLCCREQNYNIICYLVKNYPYKYSFDVV